ncbi:hypothetical protein BG000_006791 [Podila horticola]|nr:hypothetical protein BG000_006791 [Podila horticola]
MDTKVLSTQIKTARHQPLFHESHSTLSVHAKIELSKLEDDDIQQAHRVIHPYAGLDTSQIHESSMIMEPRPVLSSRDPGTSPSTPRSFVAPGSPPQRLRSPIAIATSPRSNYLLSTSPISIVSSEQGTKRFSSATSRGTARRIIYSAELEQGLPKGHIARESNYEVVGYRGLDGRLSPTSPRTSIVASSPSYASQMEAQGLSTRQVESPATIVVRPGKGASAHVTIRGRMEARKERAGSMALMAHMPTVLLLKRPVIVQMTSSVFAERIRARIHAFLFQDSPRRMNHRKRLPSAHRHQGHQGDESVQVSEIETSVESVPESEIENGMSEVSSDACCEEEEEGEEEKDQEASIRSRRMSAPPCLGLLSSPSTSSRVREFLQPMRPRSLYSVLRRISPSRYEQDEQVLELPFIVDAPLHHRIALVDGMFPMELEMEKDEEVQEQEQEKGQEEEEEPTSGRPQTSHMEQQLHEEKSMENGTSLAQGQPSPSRPRPVLINGLTCEELLHSIRFEADREGSPGYYGPAEYQHDEELRQREKEERTQEALKKQKQGSQATRKRSVSEVSSEVAVKVGGALTLAASTAWQTTALLASRIPIVATVRTQAARSTKMPIATSSLVEEDEERPKDDSI